jgi:hypothetical protein
LQRRDGWVAARCKKRVDPTCRIVVVASARDGTYTTSRCLELQCSPPPNARTACRGGSANPRRPRMEIQSRHQETQDHRDHRGFDFLLRPFVGRPSVGRASASRPLWDQRQDEGYRRDERASNAMEMSARKTLCMYVQSCAWLRRSEAAVDMPRVVCSQI